MVIEFGLALALVGRQIHLGFGKRTSEVYQDALAHDPCHSVSYGGSANLKVATVRWCHGNKCTEHGQHTLKIEYFHRLRDRLLN